MNKLTSFLAEAAERVAQAHLDYPFAEGLVNIAVDTFAGYVTNQTSLTAVTMVSGDTLTIRNFPQQTDKAFIAQLGVQSATKGQLRLFSPLLHDTTKGLTWSYSETPAPFLFAREAFLQVQPQDLLTVQMLGGSAESDAFFLSVYYTNVPGTAARLFNWSDIKPRIKTLKTIEVDATTNAITSGWLDTAINANKARMNAWVDYMAKFQK